MLLQHDDIASCVGEVVDYAYADPINSAYAKLLKAVGTAHDGYRELNPDLDAYGKATNLVFSFQAQSYDIAFDYSAGVNISVMLHLRTTRERDVNSNKSVLFNIKTEKLRLPKVYSFPEALNISATDEAAGLFGEVGAAYLNFTGLQQRITANVAATFKALNSADTTEGLSESWPNMYKVFRSHLGLPANPNEGKPPSPVLHMLDNALFVKPSLRMVEQEELIDV